MNLRFDIDDMESAIASLLAAYPEIAEDDVLRADMFEGAGLNDCLAKLLDMEREAKAMAAAVKARIDDLAVRKARYERQQDGFRDLIQQLMERADLKKVTLTEGTLSLAFRKPGPVVTDEAALPDECIRMIRKPDMTTIKAWCEAGNVPEGVSLGNGKISLTIRVK